MLQARGFYPEDGLRVLVDRSLIKIDDFGYVRMHDLIRDTGREIVRQESILEPGRLIRLRLIRTFFGIKYFCSFLCLLILMNV